MALNLIVTTAGRAAIAALGGTDAVVITEVGVSATAIIATEATAALTGEIKRIATVSGAPVSTTQVHLTIRDITADVYSLRSIALYLSDGTLFAAYGQAGAIAEKAAASVMALAIDIAFADIDTADIEFGDTNFQLPPATESVQGVVELATEAEVLAGTDSERAVTPAALAAVLAIVNNTIDTLTAALAENPHSTQLGEGRFFHRYMAESDDYKYPKGQALPLPDYQDLADALDSDPFVAADAGEKAANPGMWFITETHIYLPDMRGQFVRIWHDDLADGGVTRPARGKRKANQNKAHSHGTDPHGGTNGGAYGAEPFEGGPNPGGNQTGSSGGDEAVPDHTAICYMIRVL